jgi:hypothetical protein
MSRHRRNPSRRALVIRGLFLIFLSFVCYAKKSFAEDGLHAGFLYNEFPLTLTQGEREEALGPLFYNETRESEHTFAVPPLFSYTHNEETDSTEFDILYLLLTFDRYGSEFRWQLIQLLSFAGGETQDVVPKKRTTIFPIYFQQRSPDTNLNYTAVLPFYGTIKNRLFRDEIFFLMAPLYLQSRKRDIVTDNYLFPLFHIRLGDGLNGWQFWPIIGKEHKDITTRTNNFGDEQTIPGHDRFFALWPFYYNQTLGIGSENTEKKYGLLPLYSVLRSPNRDSTSIIWPLFNSIDDREKKYREWQGPWPFVVVARGEGKTLTRFWPLFGRGHNAILESSFYLYPLYRYNHVHSDPLDRERTRILLFLYSQVDERNTETKGSSSRTDFWPFFTYHREFDGNRRLQLLAPLEPILPNHKSIERNWSPIWSIWRGENNPTTGAASQSLLWNLYRRDTTPTTKKCSLLFGLFQYSSDADAKRWRLFYIPFGKSQTHAIQNDGSQ